MNTLIIDTTSAKQYCILLKEEEVDSVIEQGLQSVNLNLNIKTLLERNNLALSDISVFAVNVGTGSFTGIRIGIASIKGFLTALPKSRAIAINTLQVVAYTKQGDSVVLQDAGRNLFYCATYNRNIEIVAPHIIEEKEKIALLEKGGILYDLASDYTKQICQCVKDKIALNDFCDQLQPIYLRRPQAIEELNTQKLQELTKNDTTINQ
ncbi:MAG: tRNA (adenosine(37)-N6)-threonylcarbamoyltransferase complex dimerization subunit type 1 TsaB [Clostridia bacterium]